LESVVTSRSSRKPSGWVFIAMSLFVAWHAFATLLAPAPASYLKAEILPLFQPYLRLLHLNSQWAFFSPDPSYGRTVRYTLIDADGAERPQSWVDAWPRGDAAYLRMTTLAAALTAENAALVESTARRLCRQHAADKPRAVRFELHQQLLVTPDAHLGGARPFHPQYVESSSLDSILCPP
jgi:hypothetical protein